MCHPTSHVSPTELLPPLPLSAPDDWQTGDWKSFRNMSRIDVHTYFAGITSPDFTLVGYPPLHMHHMHAAGADM